LNKNPLQWLDRSKDEIVTLATEKDRIKKAQPVKAKKKRATKAPPVTAQPAVTPS
jgi:hypothetical protein